MSTMLNEFEKCYQNGAFKTPFHDAIRTADFIKFSIGYQEGVLAEYFQAAAESKIRTDALEAEVEKLRNKLASVEAA